MDVVLLLTYLKAVINFQWAHTKTKKSTSGQFRQKQINTKD